MADFSFQFSTPPTLIPPDPHPSTPRPQRRPPLLTPSLPHFAAVVVVGRRSRVNARSCERERQDSPLSRELLSQAGGGVEDGEEVGGGSYLSVPTTRNNRDSRDSRTLSLW